MNDPESAKIGPATATAIVVANMVGTGVFTTSGILLRELGSPNLVLLAWLCGGVTALFGALCYGDLARHFPESGGEYFYLSRTMPPVVSFVVGWLTLLVGFAAPLAALAYAFAEYLRPWLPPFLSPRMTGSLLLMFTLALHAKSIALGARVQFALVTFEILLITLLASFGLRHVLTHPPSASAMASHPENLGLALILVSYSYTGWNGAVYVGGEVRNPQRNLPRVLLVGTGIVTLLYLALNTFFVYSVPPRELAGRLDVAHVATLAAGGKGAASIVSALVALAVAMCASALTMTGPQVAARMAQNGLLPRKFATAPGQVPRFALLAQIALGLCALWTAAFETILTYVGISLGLSTAATVLGLVRLRVRMGSRLRVTGWPWLPSIFLLFTLGAVTWTLVSRPVESMVGLGAVLLLAVYFQTRANARGR